MEKLDFVSVQCLRKTCIDFRNFIDDVNVVSTLTEAYVVLVPNSISLELTFPDLENQIKYESTDSGCRISFFKQNSFMMTEKNLVGSSFLNVAFGDLESMLKNQKKALLSFRIDFLMGQVFDENFHSFFRKNIKSEKFQTTVISQNEIMSVLPIIDEEHLSEIHTNNMIVKKFNILDLDQIKETEQWKRCGTVRILEFLVDVPIQDFFHFKNVYVTYQSVTKEMVLELKKAFLTSPHMECFQISFQENDYKQQLTELYGRPFEVDMPLGRVERRWLFQNSETNQLLAISLFSTYVRLNRIPLENMPFGAMALP